MKVQVEVEPGHSILRFIINAENGTESAALGLFASYPSLAPKPVRLRLLTSTHNVLSLCDSLSLGYTFDPAAAPPEANAAMLKAGLNACEHPAGLGDWLEKNLPAIYRAMAVAGDANKQPAFKALA